MLASKDSKNAADEKKVDVRYTNEKGRTALHYAATNGKEQKAIDYSNIKDFNEITALILQYSHKGTVAPAQPTQQTAAATNSAGKNISKKNL